MALELKNSYIKEKTMATNQIEVFTTNVSSRYPLHMPSSFSNVLEILDDYTDGKGSIEKVMSIDQDELEQARAWLRDHSNERMVEAFPELDVSDEF